MSTEPEVPVLSYPDAPQGNLSKRGCGFIAVCVGLVVTGLGQALAGRFRRGLIWFIGCVMINAALLGAVLLPRLLLTLLVFFPLIIVWNLASLVDAYR
jgi:Na+/melibiose symporter-like transporter